MYRTWICENCSSEVSEDIFPCPVCMVREAEPKV